MSRAEAATQLTALEHLRELWIRLVVPLFVLIAGGIVAYIFREPIIAFLQKPLGEKLYYTSPMGSFQFVMQVCLLCGVVLALPFLLYNSIRFIEPAFSKRLSRKYLFLILISSLSLAAMGVGFAYYLTLPFALKFFNTVGTNLLHPLITANEYFGFVLGYLATFAIVFQIPLLLLFINHVRPFKPGGLTKFRKYIYVGAFAVSLVMPSSPDPLSQVSLAIPIICLYEVSVFLIWKVNRKKRRQHDRRVQRLSYQPATMSAKSQNKIPVNLQPRTDFSIARQQEAMRSRAQMSRRTVQPVPVRANFANPSRPLVSVQPKRAQIVIDGAVTE